MVQEKEFIQRPTTDRREGRNAEKLQSWVRSVVPEGASKSMCQANVRADGGQTSRADLTDQVMKLAANLPPHPPHPMKLGSSSEGFVIPQTNRWASLSLIHI